MKEYDLILPIKKKWFDMILSGEKKEEYRDMKPFYDKRIENILQKKYGEISQPSVEMDIKFKNGYGKEAPSFISHCKVFKRLGGNINWGATPNKWYYVFEILEVQE